MDWIQEHENNVAYYSNLIGKNINLKYEDLDNLYIAACLHDIGKNKIPNKLLCKIEPLTKDEFDMIKLHAYYGSEILRKDNYSSKVVDAVLYHHERIDGNGYYRLKSDDINLFSKIITICDSFDSMVSLRPYNAKNIKTHKEALNEIKRNLGTQFDNELGTIFIDLIKNDRNISWEI